MPPKRKDKVDSELSDKLSKEEKSVTHWLKRHLPCKKTKFASSIDVSFFIGSKAVDSLLNDSPWSKAKAKSGSLMFESRKQCVEFLQVLLEKKMFHRAEKVPVEEKPRKSKKEDKDAKSSPPNQKRKRKIKLEMHGQQLFVDGQDAYVWLYDPIPWHYWVIGSVIVLAVIAICLFPLWPNKMRLGVHYLSIAAACLVVALISLVVIKILLFVVVWLVTAGKVSFWIFPNLTEDVGFLESFKPLYECNVSRPAKKDKDSDEEGSDSESSESESDHSTSKRSSTDKDFEMVDTSEAGPQKE